MLDSRTFRPVCPRCGGNLEAGVEGKGKGGGGEGGGASSSASAMERDVRLMLDKFNRQVSDVSGLHAGVRWVLCCAVI